MEKMIIENFAGIKNAEFNINDINIIIGKQASGKSIIAKLLFYFKSFFNEIKDGILNNKSKQDIDNDLLNKFITYFPRDTWNNYNFTIKYKIKETELIITKKPKNSNIKIEYSNNIDILINEAFEIYTSVVRQQSSDMLASLNVLHFFSSKFNQLLEKNISQIACYNQIFIPAGRIFFSNIKSNIFNLLNTNISLDPFLLQFGEVYEKFKRNLNVEFKKDTQIENLINSILSSKYLQNGEDDFLIHQDGRRINLSNASSGQQEILPLLLILKVLSYLPFSKGITLYIEEPETHLFPLEQKKIVQILARIFNSSKNNFQYFITTHSPYLLSSFNNLIYAGYLENALKNKSKNRIYQIIPQDEILSPNALSAFSISENKTLINVINRETQLIDQNLLDDISDLILKEFNELIELE